MNKELIVIRQVAKVIRVIRGEKVLLDFDLAPLYGVTSGNLNKAMRRNRERFPSAFMFASKLRDTEHGNSYETHTHWFRGISNISIQWDDVPRPTQSGDVVIAK